MRRFVPWALVTLVVGVAAVSALVGTRDRSSANPSEDAIRRPLADSENPSPKSFPVVGLSLTQVEASARRHHVRIDYVVRLPQPAPAGTVEDAGPNALYQLQLVVSTGPPRSLSQPLRGAAGPPVAPECDVPVELAEDGQIGPLTCGSDHVNVAAWDYFVAAGLPVMGLGRSASTCEIASRVIPSYVTAPIDYDEVQLADAYYGWNFPLTIAENIIWTLPGTTNPCPATTAVIPIAPVQEDGELASAYTVSQVVLGSCKGGSEVASGASYSCTSASGHFPACWGAGTSHGKRAVYCVSQANSTVVTEIQVRHLPAPIIRKSGLPWLLQVADGGWCTRISAELRSRTAQYRCLDGVVTDLSESKLPWTVTFLKVDRGYASRTLRVGSTDQVSGAWIGEPAAFPSNAS